jgi:hypothetical protein
VGVQTRAHPYWNLSLIAMRRALVLLQGEHIDDNPVAPPIVGELHDLRVSLLALYR